MIYEYIINSEIDNCTNIISSRFNYVIKPSVDFTLSGMLNGRAIGDSSMLFNPKVCSVISESDVRLLVKHEYAHLVVSAIRLGKLKVHLVDDERSHGRLWKHIMGCLGVEKPRATNIFSGAEQVYGCVYRYTCSCSTYWLSKRRHFNHLQRGVNYVCTKCNHRLKLVLDAKT